MRKASFLFILLAVFGLLATGTVCAQTTHYVNPDGICGGNTPCYATIQAAINAASPGDTVYVQAGTYNEHVTIDKSLTLQGEDRDTTIIDGGGSGTVVYLSYVSNVEISGFTISNGSYGICMWHSDTNTLVNNDVSNNGGEGGIVANFCDNNIIANNTISSNGRGINFGNCYGNAIRNNTISLNGPGAPGIYFHWYSAGNTITGNTISNNWAGIHFRTWAGPNTIINNTFTSNTTHAIYLYEGSTGNTVYHNDFINNNSGGVQAYDIGGGQWDNGYPSGGNYWSDYPGVDNYSGPGQNLPGSDGIGDTPHTFVSNQDNYPLMKPLWDTIQVFIDIKPGSCPNPLNVKSKGVLPVAVLGTEDFDVTDIDPETILLTREGYEGYVVTPIRWSYEDVATPFEGEECDCHDLDGDGYLDLTLKFKTRELVDVLDLEDEAGNMILLILTGNLKEEEGGKSIIGSDCIKVLKTGKK